MKLIKNSMIKHIIYCPKCNEELYFDATSANSDYLKCLNIDCYAYFRKDKRNKSIVELGSYFEVKENMKSKGITDWEGIATSIAYKPKWVKFIEYFSGK